MARRKRIISRDIENVRSLIGADNLVLADDGEITPADVFQQEGWSPYCFDEPRRETLFVRLPEEFDLAKSAFVYADQLKYAIEVAVLSNAELITEAKPYQTPEISIIFSIGRCGTTLANHVLNASPEMVCLSEPSVIEQVGQYHGEDQGDLLGAYLRQFFAVRAKKSAHVLGIKPRSQALFHARNFSRLLPNSRNVFMYRDAVNWAHSFFDWTSRLGFHAPYAIAAIDRACSVFMLREADDLRAIYLDLNADNLDPGIFWGHAWALHLQVYRDLRAEGLTMAPVRYNEFNTDRLAGVRQLFAACGISAEAAKAALAAFDTDSQAGTRAARAAKPMRLSAESIGKLRTALAQHSGFENPDIILN